MAGTRCQTGNRGIVWHSDFSARVWREKAGTSISTIRYAGMKALDDFACGLLEQAGNERMNQRCTSRRKKQRRKPQGKTEMLEIVLVY